MYKLLHVAMLLTLQVSHSVVAAFPVSIASVLNSMFCF